MVIRNHWGLTGSWLLIVFLSFVLFFMENLHASPRSQNGLALTHARLIDGTNAPIRQNMTIVIDGKRIKK